MGSVKDLVVHARPTGTATGAGIFNFSGRYSVFDWGEMPDRIPNKGASLCMMSAYSFEQLEREGVKTHYNGVVDDGMLTRTDAVTKPATQMHVTLVQVVKPGFHRDVYDYSWFNNVANNFVVPLEVIYRNTLPKGSSVFRRLQEGSLSLQSMGLSKMPEEGAQLPRPFLDVSTKYEEFDRYPDERRGESVREFFRKLAGLTPAEIAEIERMTMTANSIITAGVSRAGMRNDDGKLEFAFADSTLMVVDALGTLDESRFTYNVDGQWIEVSKEIPRQWYRHRQPDWVAEIDAAKKSGNKNWKSLVTKKPEPLPTALADMLSLVYSAAANAVLQRQLFDAPPLETVVQEYKRFRELEMR